MYPSLTSIGSGSRWYSKKQTPQENLMEITELENQLAERRAYNLEVGVPIMIRGKPTISNKIMNIEKEDDRMEEEEEAEEEGEREEDEEEVASNVNNSYNMYDSGEEEDGESRPVSPDYPPEFSPTSLGYAPNYYSPTSPGYNPQYETAAAEQQEDEHEFQPTSPGYRPSSPDYRPTSPSYRPPEW
jgi:hypothetical protein